MATPDDTNLQEVGDSRAKSIETLKQEIELVKAQISAYESLGDTELKYSKERELRQKQDQILLRALRDQTKEITNLQAQRREAERQGNKERLREIENEINKKQDLLQSEAKKREVETQNLNLLDDMTDSMSKIFSIATKKPTGLIGQAVLNPKAFLGAAKNFAKTINPAYLLANSIAMLAANSLKLAVELDAATVSFNRATGQIGSFNTEVSQTSIGLIGTGISARDASQAYQDLFATYTDFSRLNRSSRKDVVEVTALLGKMGVATGVLAQNMQIATKALGMNANQAADLQIRLRNLAISLGKPVEEVAKDFGVAANTLAALGEEGNGAVSSFALLEVQSKATGLSVQKLIDVTSQFDTFDQAAQSVGRLNAILGGPFLNTLRMTATTDPAERMRLLADSLDRAGVAFDDLSYYEKKAIADAAGLADVNDLALLLSGNISSLTAPQLDSSSIIELKNQTMQFNTVMEELAELGRSFAIAFRPIIPILKAMTRVVHLLLSPFKFLGQIFESMAHGLSIGFSPSFNESIQKASEELETLKTVTAETINPTQKLKVQMQGTAISAANVSKEAARTASNLTTTQVAAAPQSGPITVIAQFGTERFDAVVAKKLGDRTSDTYKTLGKTMNRGGAV
tara:strand:+ start:1026 stop:2918 length:1893 start_codon:yes stop_codon:yes gene_type:complete